jgi:glycosyltransferase involved in cell wall biosynthesis
MLANTIVLFSPLVRRQLAEDALMGWTVRRAALAPLPPNLAVPEVLADSPFRETLAAARKAGRVVLGHFGSIYPGKQPDTLLAIGARLKKLGHRPLLAYVGSFIRGTDNVEQDFYARAKELGVTDDVVVSGFVASSAELFGILSEVDVLCYRLDEGLSARRASILAAAQSGRPVIVTAPAERNECAHHPVFESLIEQGAIILIDRQADDHAYAQAALAAAKRPTRRPDFDVDASWRDAARAISAHF